MHAAASSGLRIAAVRLAQRDLHGVWPADDTGRDIRRQRDLQLDLLGRRVIVAAGGGRAASLEELREFHDRLYGLYCRDFSGDVPVLHHMRDVWNYFSRSFRETDTLLRQVRKAGDCRAYETAVRQFFYGAELSH